MSAIISTPSEDRLTLWSREEMGERDLTINGILFDVPPQNIRITEENKNFQARTMRTSESVKNRSGHGRIRVSLSAIVSAPGREAFLKEMNASLMPMLYSMRRFPLCFVENELVRSSVPVGDLEPMAFMVQSVDVGTVSGQPHAVSVVIQLVWFNHRPYSPRLMFRSEWYNRGAELLAKAYKAGKKGHRGRHEFVDAYGPPGMAYNMTAAYSVARTFEDARPLHEHLWPHLMESTWSNPEGDEPMDRELARIDVGVAPFALSSTSGRIDFTFTVYSDATKIQTAAGEDIDLADILDGSTGGVTRQRVSQVLNHGGQTRQAFAPTAQATYGTGTDQPPAGIPASSIARGKARSRERYPKQWDGIIQSAADKTGVDPMLIAAVMMAESRGVHFRSGAFRGVLRGGSKRGAFSATGLMQIAAGSVPKMYGFSRDTKLFKTGRDDRMDPEKNVLMGAIIIAGLMRRSKTKSVEELIWKYNRGEHRFNTMMAQMKEAGLTQNIANVKPILTAKEAGWDRSGPVYIVRAANYYSRFSGGAKKHPLYMGNYSGYKGLPAGVVATPPAKIQQTLAQRRSARALVDAGNRAASAISGAAAQLALATGFTEPPEDDALEASLMQLSQDGWTFLRNTITKKVALSKNVTLSVFPGDARAAPNEGVVINSVTVSFHNNVVQLPISGHRFPTSQYMGGQVSGATLSIFLVGVLGRGFLETFKHLVGTSEMGAITHREFSRTRGVYINNPLLNGLGIEEAVIEGVTVEPAQGLPDTLIMNVTLLNAKINAGQKPVQHAGRHRMTDSELGLTVVKILLEGGVIKTWVGGNPPSVDVWGYTPKFKRPDRASRAIGEIIRVLDTASSRDRSPNGGVLRVMKTALLQGGGVVVPDGGFKTWMHRRMAEIAREVWAQRSVMEKMTYDQAVSGSASHGRGIGRDEKGVYAAQAKRVFSGSKLQLSLSAWAAIVGGNIPVVDDTIANTIGWTEKVNENALDELGIATNLGLMQDLVSVAKDLIVLERETGLLSSAPYNLEELGKMTEYLGVDEAYSPLGDALPDLRLPPCPITGLTLDFSPDAFFYNESDRRAGNSAVQELIFGGLSPSQDAGIAKGIATISNRVENLGIVHGTVPPTDTFGPANVGQGGRRALSAPQTGPATDNNKTRSVKGVESTFADMKPDLTQASLDGTKLASRNTLSSSMPKGGAQMFDEASPLAREIARGRDRILQGTHLFTSGEYKKTFAEFAEHYHGDHYTLRRAFPAYKVYIVEEEGVDSKNTENEWLIRLMEGDAMMLEDFYGVNSIQSIRIINNKTMAASVCMIDVLDISGVLYNRSYIDEGSNFGLRKIAGKAKKNPFKDTIIKDGAKIVVAMGYGNDPEGLTTVFVGQIVKFGGDGLVQIVCQSYGSELVQQVFGTDPDEEADFGNSTTGNLIHGVLDREEIRHFGRWRLSEIEPLNALLSAQELRPDGKFKTIWTVTPSVIDDNIYVPAGDRDCAFFESEDYMSCWDTFWGNVEYVFMDSTVWGVLSDMTLRHPGAITYPVPFGHGADARMTIFFGNPAQKYIAEPASSALKELLGSKNRAEMLKVIKGVKLLQGANAGVPFAGMGVAPLGGNKRRPQRGGASQPMSPLAQQTFAALSSRTRKRASAIAAAVGTGASEQEMLAATQAEMMGWKMRPFRNYEMATSAHNIISNSIRTDIVGTMNSVEMVYSDGNVDFEDFQEWSSISTIIVNADDNIRKHHIRRQTVYAPNVSTEDLARRGASQTLANSLKATYQGSLLLTGMANLKPFDTLWLNDLYSDMAGPIEVEETVQSMTVETGFTTEVVPNMIVSVNEDATVTAMDAMTTLFTEHLAGYAKAATIGALGGVAVGTAIKGAAGAAAGAKVLASGGWDSLGAVGTVGIDSAISVAGTAIGTPIMAANAATSDTTGEFYAGLAGSVGAAAIMWQPLVFGPATVMAGYMFYKFVKYNLTREPIVITPLIKQGKPFVAGIEGFETDGLVVSDLWHSDQEVADKALDKIVTRKWRYWSMGIEDTSAMIDVALTRIFK